MMKIIIADLTGRTRLYDEMLFSSIRSLDKGRVRLLMPGHGLLCLIPKRYQSSSNSLKRLIKIIECLINYFLLGFHFVFSRKYILHLQWLPFLEVSSLEYYFLLLYKLILPQLKIVLTVHNIYPHDIKENRRKAYKRRLLKVDRFIDAYIVHTSSSKNELSLDFNIKPERINVCPHGVFMPLSLDLSCQNTRINEKLKVLMFGIHSFYKGTDILVQAVNKLPDDYRKRLDVHIVGLIGKDYLDSMTENDDSDVITWKNYYLDDKELGEEISQCDLIILPYRKISQSGVLLMALNCKRMIICADLPSFKETLHGSDNDCLYDDYLFFESGVPDSLSALLKDYIDRKVPESDILKRMNALSMEYTWEKSAEKTVDIYQRLFS